MKRSFFSGGGGGEGEDSDAGMAILLQTAAAAVEPCSKATKTQVTLKAGANVPVMEVFPGASSHHVYVEDGLVYSFTGNQTNIAGNNNKFYRLQLLVSALARWGGRAPASLHSPCRRNPTPGTTTSPSHTGAAWALEVRFPCSASFCPGRPATAAGGGREAPCHTSPPLHSPPHCAAF